MSIVFGRNRKTNPIENNIIAAASQGFHMFHAQTENLCLMRKIIIITMKAFKKKKYLNLEKFQKCN